MIAELKYQHGVLPVFAVEEMLFIFFLIMLSEMQNTIIIIF